MPREKGLSRKPKTILVVDDEPLVCALIERFMSQEQHQVDTAANAHEALPKIAANHYDLIITDYNMPGMKGDELARIIKQQDPSRHVVLLIAMPLSEAPPAVDCLINKSAPLQNLRLQLAPFLDKPSTLD